MAESIKQKLGFVVAAMMVVAGLAALNLGTPADAQQQECEPSGGGGNQTGSPSPSPSESEEPFPPSLPPIIPSESESSSPSPTESEGEDQTCPSQITINYQGPNKEHPERREFSGKVKSAEDSCEDGRKVILKKDRRGKRDLTVDTTVTNPKGAWSIPVNRANGKYYAKTPKQKVPVENAKVTCGAAKSRTIEV